jgi:hypothetical protein
MDWEETFWQHMPSWHIRLRASSYGFRTLSGPIAEAALRRELITGNRLKTMPANT